MYIAFAWGGHLPALYFRDPAMRVYNKDIRRLETAERLHCGTAGIAAGGANNCNPFFSPL